MNITKKQLSNIVIVALICLTVVESIALLRGINGAIFGTVVSVFGVFIGAAGACIFYRRK